MKIKIISSRNHTQSTRKCVRIVVSGKDEVILLKSDLLKNLLKKDIFTKAYTLTKEQLLIIQQTVYINLYDFIIRNMEDIEDIYVRESEVSIELCSSTLIAEDVDKDVINFIQSIKQE